MAIEFAQQYDQESDTFFITAKTGEPVYVLETEDDNILIEVGFYTNRPAGLRILNFKSCASKSLNIKEIASVLKTHLKRLEKTKAEPSFHDMEVGLQNTLSKVLA